MGTLLAVDLGLKTGLALYDGTGRLVWYRSRHFGTADRLRRRVYSLLRDLADLEWVVLEGGGPLAEIWAREASRRGVGVRRIAAEAWRGVLLYDREHRSGRQAKISADSLARRVIEGFGARRPTSLRHDAAEAILIGLWGVMEVGWRDGPPATLRGS